MSDQATTATTDPTRATPDRLARGLGWLSFGLGLPQLVVPGRVNRLIGVDDNRRNRSVMRAVGVRELAGGAGILDRPRPAGFLVGRVSGDVVDLLLLGAASRAKGTRAKGTRAKGTRAKGNRRRRVASAAVAVAGVTVLDVVAAARTRRSADPRTGKGAVRGRTSITVNRPPDDVYRFWHRFENLPTFMHHLQSVGTVGEGRSHWVAKAPAGKTVSWDAEVVEDIPNELIAWSSLEGADVPNSGSVRFAAAPGGRGTEVSVEVEYRPPGGSMGAAVARLFGEEPVQQMKDDIRRFKQVIETGEVVRSDGTPEGTRTQRQFFQREAQPA